MYREFLRIAVISDLMKLDAKVLKRIGGGVCASPMTYFFILLLFPLFNHAFYLFSGKLHLYIYNYFAGGSYNNYSVDLVVTVVKNVLIINWQILLILAGLKIYNLSVQDIGWHSANNLWKVIAGVIGIVLYRLFSEVSLGGAAGQIIFPSIAQGAIWDKLHNPMSYYFLFIVPFVLPLFEELFYRGFIFTLVDRKIGWIWAVLLSSIAFSAIHGNSIFSFYPEVFFRGIVYGLLRKWDGSIWSSVAAHSANNLIIAWFAIKV